MNITDHAFNRMVERGFSCEMLGRLLNGKKKILPAGNGRFKVVGSIGNDYWTLIVEPDLYTLVTVRRAHEDETC